MKTFILSIIATSAISFSQEMHTVYAGNMYFQPSELNINQGDSVEFINEGGYHDVVVTSGPEILSLEPCSGPCDIGVLVFDVVGDYDYECSIGSHASQGMVGTIVVAAVQQLSQVQIIHNSPYPVVDVYVDGEVALNSVPYRAVTGMIDLPASTTVGIAPAGGSVIAEFPFELEQNGTYVVTASGIVGDESTPFDLVPSSLELTAVDDQSFALKVYHGATDAPPVDIYANGSLLVENIAYGNYAGYLQVPEGDYTIDVTAHGSLASVASFYAPLTGQGGGSGIVYASGFLSPTEQDSAFTLILATPSGYSVELPNTESALQPSQVQIIHNSPYPVVDVYVDGEVALNSVPYRAVTGMIDLPASTTVGIAPAGGSVIAEFPFELEQNGTYVVTASGIVGDESTPFDLVPSSLELTAVDDQSFALKVYHGATDAPPVDIYANGSLLVENIAYGNYAGYLQVPEGDYTIDVTAHGSLASVASFYAPLTGQGGGSGIVYASGFLSPTEQDSAFTLILATPSGYSVELPNTESALQITNERNIVLEGFTLQQNYPNPFNPNTSITFNLTKNQLVNLTIYDLRGNEIKSLYNNTAEAGTHKINWNGLDNLGKKVSSGVLIYTLKTNYGVDTKKMVLVK